MELDQLRLICEGCGTQPALADLVWQCPACGEPLRLRYPPLSPDAALSGQGVWRYGPWLPQVDPVSLGEPTTPMAEVSIGGHRAMIKLEGAQPTGSFKDRGSAAAVSVLRALGVFGVSDDSSGNAGASLAAYCAGAGIGCQIYAPATTSPQKLKQVGAFGAQLVTVPGPRSAATEAARTRSGGGGFTYMPHAWSPLHLLGTRTFAFEVWEQLDRTAPGAVVLPVGAGTLLLGLFDGFSELMAAGLIDEMPQIYGVQAESCAPLASDQDRAVSMPCEPSVAEGILVGRPPREQRLRTSVASTGGRFLAVPDDDIVAAHDAAARSGIYIEPTSAVAWAGAKRLLELGQLRRDRPIVLAATGNGLKSA